MTLCRVGASIAFQMGGHIDALKDYAEGLDSDLLERIRTNLQEPECTS